MKDALCLWANTGIPAIAIQGEGYGISDTAVNELGMVYPNRSQVINYDSKESEYVKQYKDIAD